MRHEKNPTCQKKKEITKIKQNDRERSAWELNSQEIIDREKNLIK